MSFPLTSTAWFNAAPLFAAPQDGASQLPFAARPAEYYGPYKDGRLGHRFEALVTAHLAQYKELELVHHNLALYEQKRTIGELDLVLFHHRLKEYWHWELTHKHYLGVFPDYWPGPNVKDHFHRKYHHSVTHQFPLALSNMAQRSLSAPIDKQFLFSRGILYYPATGTLAPPSEAHDDHIRGTWWLANQLPTHNKYLILPKSYWLTARLLTENPNHWHPAEFVIEYFNTVDSPLLVLQKRKTGELHPGFVVNENWLNHAKRHYTDHINQQ